MYKRGDAEIRDYLLACLTIENYSHPGNYYMKISELNKHCEIKDDHYVFTKRHKTSAVRGPAPTQLSNILKTLLQKYMEKWRTKSDSDSVFVSNTGVILKSNEVRHFVKRHLMKCNICILNIDFTMSKWRKATSRVKCSIVVLQR